jgi:ATP-dependent HslUV protease ATP-binding subunit HslU
MERVFESLSFEAPDLKQKSVTIDEKYVNERLGEVVKDEDLSKFIL